ncbi:MAG: glycosyltransferase family 4 protein [Synergistaceae bacterium]|jgi:glycosyltransferase involved in cell wall biosynthesis|nr:glycosyltransferase family 4 protein [Synergistaceae bacterium]
MRILSISLGRRGGFPVYGLEMTRALAEICDVSLLVASGSENIDEWRKMSCRRMEVSTYHNNISGVLSFVNIPKFLAIKKYILECEPDIVYYPGSHYWKFILDRIVPQNTPIAMTVHDPLIHPGEGALINKIIAALETRRPDLYILLNESQKDAFIRSKNISEEQVLVLPHGIFSSYRNSVSKLENFQEFESLKGHTGEYFLFVGRIIKYKGIETMLKAFRDSLDKTKRILVIAGSGTFSESERSEIAKIPQTRLKIFNHWLSDSEIATLTANAFMTILPYEGATQSGVIPMSAAFGTPSIASDSGGLKEQIIEGETGFIFPSGDAGELENDIIKSSELSNETYLKMRKETLRNATEKWDWGVLALKLVDFLEAARDNAGNS